MEKIMQQIRPSPAQRQRFEHTADKIIQSLTKNLQNAQAILGGSGAKDTWLASSHDIDIFVQFEFETYKDKSNELADFLERTLTKTFPEIEINRVHGSRDYFQFEFENHFIEVVPILAIKNASQAINITDVSPLHTIWVNENAAHLKDDIRKAKQFAKAQNVYGAESYIGGFSGYILEILVVYYGSFEKLLQAMVKSKVGSVIDVARFYPKKDALFHLNKSKTTSAIIVIDPVDKSRNAAAALSIEKFNEFKKAAKAYCKNPLESFFIANEFTEQYVKEIAGTKPFVRIALEPLKGKRDVVGMKLKKAVEYIATKLEAFGVRSYEWRWPKGEIALCYFVLNTRTLPAFLERQGPPISMKEHAKDFRAKNSDVFEQDAHLVAKIKVDIREVEEFVKAIIERPYIKERTKSCRLL